MIAHPAIRVFLTHLTPPHSAKPRPVDVLPEYPPVFRCNGGAGAQVGHAAYYHLPARALHDTSAAASLSRACVLRVLPLAARACCRVPPARAAACPRCPPMVCPIPGPPWYAPSLGPHGMRGLPVRNAIDWNYRLSHKAVATHDAGTSLRKAAPYQSPLTLLTPDPSPPCALPTPHLLKPATDPPLTCLHTPSCREQAGALPPWAAPVERLVTFLHCNNVKVETAKTTTYLERSTMAQIHRAFYNFSDDFYTEHSMNDSTCLGQPTSGGTVANLQALWTARNTASLATGDAKDGVILASQYAHYSVSKALDVLGLGEAGLVTVPTTDFKMDVGALKTALEGLQRSNRKVLAIVAIAGTTEAGAFDPIREIADLGKKYGAWVHVDAAWAGGLIFAPTARNLFDGIELADSITVDAHKSLFAPMGFGMALYRSPYAARAITKEAEYIIRKGEPDLGKFSLEGSRSAQALHLHACLAALGRSGLSAVAEHKLHVTRAFAALIEADPAFELFAQPESDILLFRARKPFANTYVHDVSDNSSDLDLQRRQDEEHEQELDDLNTRLHAAQKLQGRTFVSRTAVMDPRRDKAGSGKVARSTKTKVLRVVVNAQVTLENCSAVLEDLRLISTCLALDPAPLDEARTLVQTLAHSVIHAPHSVAVRTADLKLPLSASANGQVAAAKAFADAIPESETGKGTAGVGSLTYWQLMREALHVSAHLTQTAPGGVVPIMCGRNVDAYVAVVATLLRGATWLLIDSSLPPQRISHFIAEATPGCELLVSDNCMAACESAQAILIAKGQTRTLYTRSLTTILRDLRADESATGVSPLVMSRPPTPTPPRLAAQSDAYMIFTSGSTGLPKAVKIAHLQLCDLLRAFAERWGGRMTCGKDSALAQISWAWDMHVLDMWLPLSQGATVRLLREEERLDGARVAAAIDRTAAEAAERDGHLRWIQGTPTFYRTVLGGGWLGDGGSGLTLISSGEPMPADLARSLLLRCHTLVNCYGLTECTIFQAFEQLTLPTSVQTDGVARDAETGVLRLPDISCGRACYSYENDDKCEVVLCRVAASELSAASAELDESTNEFATAEDDGLRRAKAVKNGLKLERVEGTDVVGQVCFAGTCLPRQGYHNAQELNDAKFLDYSMLQEVGGPTTATTASLRKNEANDSMASMTSVASTGSTDLSSSWLQVSSSASDGDSGDRAPPPPRRMMLSGDLGKWRADGKLQILGRVDGIVKVLGSRVDLSEAETALRQLETHVSDAAVVAVDDPTNDDKTSSKVLVAYFVPTVQANAQAAQDGLAAIADEVDLWESIYDDAYSKKDALGAAHDENHARDAKGEQGTNYDDELAGLTAEDMITNWSAYISSYTDKLWPRSTIEHWVNATVDRFLDMKPKRILELGSGNGMLAYRAALRPEVEEVWMADLSSEASRYVERLRVHPHFAHIAHKCKVLHRPADDFKDIPDNHFDCVAMNAMVMYFPSVEYMTDVLRKCSKCLRPGGSVYIGCCRSLEHLQHFHTDVTLFNATNDDAPALELRRACLQRRAKEKELLLSPDYFYRHAKTMPGCFDKVAILLRRGYDCPKTDEKGADPRHADAPVEMTRWRYDVFLLKGSLPAEDGVAVPKGKIPTLDSTERLRMIRQHNFEGEKTLHEAVDSLMRPADKGSADAILVRNVPNARVLDAVACELVIDQVIAEGERCGTPSTVGGVRRAIKNKIQQLAASNGGVGVCPEAFLEYVERVGEGRLGAQMMFTPHATSDTNMAASGTNAAAHLFDVTIYRLGNGGPPAMPLRECRFRTGELHTKVDYGRMQVAPLLSHLNMIELGGIQHRHQGGEGRHEECYGNKRGWGGVQKMLASSLRQTLPSFAMPTHYVPVDVLPLLPTGKTDKRNLPSAHAALVLRGSERNTAFRAPSTATERTLVAFFTQYISCNLEIGVDHDFGELGGNSLLAGRLVNACKRAFGVDLTMGAFFEKRTPAKIAAFIDEEMGSLSKDDQERLDAAAAAECTAQDVSPASKSHGISVYDTFIPVPATPGAAAGGGSTILLHARVWRPTIVPTNGHVALVDFAPYPLSFMTTHVDDATYYPLALRGLTCIRVSARGTDRSQGACGDPYDFAGVHTPDLTAVIERIASTGLADGTAADGTTAPPVDAFGSVILHGFSWAATVALRVLALPDGVRPSAIKAACLCMGNDELHESDAFFERRVPLAFNWMWTSQFEALMARPPTDLANDPTTGATWQHQWLDRLEALGNLPAKYMCATRDPSRDARWKKQSLSGQADPALEGRSDDDALLKGLGKIAVPVLAAGASFLGRYGDTVERLVRSRGVAEASGRPLPEVKGIIGPWVHAFPHLSAVGPNVDWIGMVVDFAHRHTSSATPPPPESSLTYFETESIPLGPALPMRWPGHYRVVPARALAHSATTPPVAPPAVLSATAAGTLVPRSEPLAAGVGTVPDAEVCGQMGGEWFSWGVNSDLPVDQSVDDARSLCFEMKPAAMGVDGLTVRGVPKVTLLLADETAHRALTAQTSGLDCIVARLCVVDETGASHLAALGTASLTLAEAVADMRSGARHDSMPLAKLELDLHFCALTLAPKHTLRLALSTSYFPLFLATGGCGGADLASVSLELPNIGGAPVELPPPALDAHPTTLQRVRMPRHERHALASGNFGAHTLQDDGTVRTHDGLSAGMRSEMYVEVLRGRRIAMKTTVQTTLSKGSEFAQLRVNTSLSTDHADKHNAIATTTVEAIACGAPLWSKTFTARIVI